MKKVLYLLVLFACVTFVAYSGGQNRAGTSAASELLIPVGARYVAMGGSPVATATGLESIYWNPAGVDITEKSANAMFSYRKYIADINLNYFAVSGKFGFGSIALSLRTLDFGDIPVTTVEEPDGTGELFSPTFFIGGLTYSKRLTDRIAVGVSLNFIHESWPRVSANGVALDFGVQYRDLFKVPGLSIGVVVKNIGFPMKYSGPGLWIQAVSPGTDRGLTFYKIEAAEFDLPSVIEIGFAYKLMIGERSGFNFAATFQNNNYAYDEYRVGIEYSFGDLLYLRGGYLLTPEATEEIPYPFQNFTAGVGLNFTNVGGLDISLDYAFIPPAKFFATNHVVAIKVGF